MTEVRHIEQHSMDWQGIALSVSFERDWLNMGTRSQYGTAHLEVQAVNPKNAPLPITETGYRSHFIPADQIDRLGGPVKFVELWIEGASRSTTWREFQKTRRTRDDRDRRLSLFWASPGAAYLMPGT